MINREKTNWASCLSSDTQLQKQHDRKKITTPWAFAEQQRLDTHPEIDNILGNSKKSFFNFLEKLPTKIINCLHFEQQFFHISFTLVYHDYFAEVFSQNFSTVLI